MTWPGGTLHPPGRLAQLGERLVDNQEVGGSRPSPPTSTVFLEPRAAAKASGLFCSQGSRPSGRSNGSQLTLARSWRTRASSSSRRYQRWLLWLALPPTLLAVPFLAYWNLIGLRI